MNAWWSSAWLLHWDQFPSTIKTGLPDDFVRHAQRPIFQVYCVHLTIRTNHHTHSQYRIIYNISASARNRLLETKKRKTGAWRTGDTGLTLKPRKHFSSSFYSSEGDWDNVAGTCCHSGPWAASSHWTLTRWKKQKKSSHVSLPVRTRILS